MHVTACIRDLPFKPYFTYLVRSLAKPVHSHWDSHGRPRRNIQLYKQQNGALVPVPPCIVLLCTISLGMEGPADR